MPCCFTLCHATPHSTIPHHTVTVPPVPRIFHDAPITCCLLRCATLGFHISWYAVLRKAFVNLGDARRTAIYCVSLHCTALCCSALWRYGARQRAAVHYSKQSSAMACSAARCCAALRHAAPRRAPLRHASRTAPRLPVQDRAPHPFELLRAALLV